MNVRDRCRPWIERLAGESGPPQRVAAAFALGVFLSFSPLLGLQIAIGLGAAFLLRLSRAAVFAGLCTNLPILMIPWYLFMTAIGAAILGVPAGPEVGDALRETLQLPAYRAAFWQRMAHVLGPVLWAFVVGTTTGALIAGAIAYGAAVTLLVRIRAPRSDA